MIDLLKPGKANVQYIPAGSVYASSIRVVELDKTDLPSIARGHLEILKTTIQKVLPLQKDKITSYHLKDVLKRITLALDPK